MTMVPLDNGESSILKVQQIAVETKGKFLILINFVMLGVRNSSEIMFFALTLFAPLFQYSDGCIHEVNARVE